MIERYLFTVIQEGLTRLLAEPDVLKMLLTSRQFFMESNEADAVIAGLTKRPPTVVQGYPREDMPFPLIAIFLGNEHESAQFVGGFVGSAAIDDLPQGALDLIGTNLTGSLWDHTYHVRVCDVRSPDVATYLFQLVKFVLLQGRIRLLAKDILNIKYSSPELSVGMLALDKSLHLPDFVFSRVIAVQCQSIVTVPADLDTLREIGLENNVPLDQLPPASGGYITIQSVEANLANQSPFDSSNVATDGVSVADSLGNDPE